MQNLVDINEFMEMLKANDLLIVSAGEFQLNNNIKKHNLMKRKALSCAEIVSAQLLPLTTNKSIIDWTKSGKIKENEFYFEKTGRKRMMIMTSAIKRLGYAE
jgi:hypothetical protein